MEIQQLMRLIVLVLIVGLAKAEKMHKLSFYLHDFALYKRASLNTATVEVPASKTMSTFLTQFGKMYVFDDKLTEGPSLASNKSVVIGRAQGMYVYCGRDQASTLWSFTAFIDGKGSITFLGVEAVRLMTSSTSDEQRVLAIVGGSGLFSNARGSAHLATTAFGLPNFFVLHFDVTMFTPS